MNKIKRVNGFTLIEILTVLFIVGILASIILVYLGHAQIKARDVRRMSDLRQLLTAEEIYNGQFGFFSTSTEKDFLPVVGPYFPLTDDPLAHAGRHYKWLDNSHRPDDFCAFAHLEIKNDCQANQEKYFIVYPGGTRTVCLASPPRQLEDCKP